GGGTLGVRRVLERKQGRSIHVVELIVVDGPEERGRRADQQDERQRDHHEQRVHAVPAARMAASPRVRGSGSSAAPIRIAFRTTTIELIDMPSAASHGGTNPSAASGIAARL